MNEKKKCIAHSTREKGEKKKETSLFSSFKKRHMETSFEPDSEWEQCNIAPACCQQVHATVYVYTYVYVYSIYLHICLDVQCMYV